MNAWLCSNKGKHLYTCVTIFTVLFILFKSNGQCDNAAMNVDMKVGEMKDHSERRRLRFGLVEKPRKIRSYMDMKFFRVDRQMSEYTCGLATLATLFTYFFDLPVQEDEIANDFTKAIMAEKRGISFLDMKRFIQGKGYKALGYKVNLSALHMILQETFVPIIVHTMKEGEYGIEGHFSLLLGFHNGYFILKDPAFGNVVVSEDRFGSDFTGNIMIALPEDEHDKKGIILDKLLNILKYEIIKAKEYLKRVNYYEKYYYKPNYNFYSF